MAFKFPLDDKYTLNVLYYGGIASCVSYQVSWNDKPYHFHIWLIVERNDEIIKLGDTIYKNHADCTRYLDTSRTRYLDATAEVHKKTIAEINQLLTFDFIKNATAKAWEMKQNANAELRQRRIANCCLKMDQYVDAGAFGSLKILNDDQLIDAVRYLQNIGRI